MNVKHIEKFTVRSHYDIEQVQMNSEHGVADVQCVTCRVGQSLSSLST